MEKSLTEDQYQIEDMAYDQEFDRVHSEIVANLEKTGVDKDRCISMLDVFDDMVLTGLQGEEREAMTRALLILYRHRPSLKAMVDKHIDYVARIATERALGEYRV